MDIEAEEEGDDDYIENDEEEEDYTGIGSLQKIRDNLNEEKTKEAHNETDEAVANNKFSGFKNSSITKAPTNEEIQELRETADLFKSNIFKLQIDELLSEVNIDYNATTRLENALHKLKQIFENIDNEPELTISEITDKILKHHKIVIPFPVPRPTNDIKYKFGFKKPNAFYLVGSYPLKSVVRRKDCFNVDVAVIMPRSLFQEKDYMNYRYFHKRAYYLAVLAAALKNNKLGLNVKVEFGTLDGDNRRPILLLKPSGDHTDTDFSKLNCVIRVLPSISPETFPSKRLSPSRNNVRPYHEINESQNSGSDLPPTPQYNNAILSDMYYVRNLHDLYKQSKLCAAFADACKLAKVWLNQRGFGGDEDGSSGFNGFVWSMLMKYLLQGGGHNGEKKLANGFSSYQLMKGTMDFLAKHDFVSNPVFMNKSSKTDEFNENTFKDNFEVVFVDDYGTLNLFGRMSKASLDQLQHEAKLAMDYLNESHVDRFEDLFLKKVDDIKLRYDNVAKITQLPKSYNEYDESAKLNFPDIFIHFARTMPKLLKQGLTNRVNLIAVNYSKLSSWLTSEQPKTYSSSNIHIYIGFIFNPDESNRLVDYGPSPVDEIAVAKFRKLWGKKAETRRFKDGNILECMVWDSQKGIESRSLIVNQIVLHLMALHYRIKENKGIQYWAEQLNKFVMPSSNVPRNIWNPELSNQGFQHVMNAYDNLVKQCYALEDLLLRVSSIKGSSPSLRYSSVFTPQPIKLKRKNGVIIFPSHYIEPIDIIIQFEYSTKWPDDLVAIQKMKIAFYILLSNQFKKQFPETKTRVVAKPNLDTIISTDAFLEVFSTTTGFSFRCFIHHERELILLDRGIKNKMTTSIKRDVYTNALLRLKRKFIYLPLHNTQIQTLCNKYPSLSLAIRLTKRWFGAHLLTSIHIEEEFIEILCAVIYLSPSPWERPSSGFVGFLRVLKFIAGWDLKNDPVIVDLDESNDSKRGGNVVIERFKNMRKADGNYKHSSMFLATINTISNEGIIWGEEKPSKVVAIRIKELAKAAIECVDKIIFKGGKVDNKELFITPLQDYDAIIHLNPNLCTRYYQNLNPDKSYFEKNNESLNNTKSNNILKLFELESGIKCYVNELKKIYSDTALFFYDKYGGSFIGLVWNPINFIPKPWKVNTGFSSCPVGLIPSGERNKVSN
ncbi:Nrap protein [Rhizophagus irregularis]|uniref:U3 small nucleolar RNA-associated protein 22 n=1 Tax=Rhizophagus irregularis TaxID=588596 RepID=A0A2I1FU36_9GLOM|nr:Nrap protein [Rhizophagus irregularis]